MGYIIRLIYYLLFYTEKSNIPGCSNMVLVDFAATFDTVSRECLLNVLELFFNFGDYMLSWVKCLH